MSPPEQIPINLSEGRFSRLEAIEWWDQSRLGAARILVVGAGALGNEIIKNLALLGAGHLVVVDMDRMELSNLSRSVLFRESDAGLPKAECAARGAKSLYPGIRVRPIVGNISADVGFGWFRWAQVVVSAVDNREARVFVNSACARLGRPWIDGGIEVLNGIARGFAPPATACYECTMSELDWDLLNRRRSCSLLAQRAMMQRGTPTTPTTASVVAGIQTQEAVKFLHGRESLMGKGFVFEGDRHTSYTVAYPLKPDCPWHDSPAPVVAARDLSSETPLEVIWKRAAENLGGLDGIDLGREVVEELECASCHSSQQVWKLAEKLSETELACSTCGAERSLKFLHSILLGSALLKLTARQLGLPAWDVLWARRGDRQLAMELAGDEARCLADGWL